MNAKYNIIGLMSGTSLDGLDIVKCTYIKKKKWTFNLEHWETITYSDYWRERLTNLHLKSEKEIIHADIEYGFFLGEKVKDFCKKYKCKADYVSSHGHTIFHNPSMKHSLQIGNGSSILKSSGINCINNFRELDVNNDGQGAPLVPIGDLLLFNKYKYCLNLGGFANISKKNKDHIIAFDICPVNYILNHYTKILGHEYDINGSISMKGKINNQLLIDLNNIDFYRKNNPKSLSREWVELKLFPIIKLHKIPIEDILKTYIEHIALQIGKHLKNKEVLITGGGTFNLSLINRIKHYSSSKIIIPKKEIIEFKEAIIFGLLGVLKLRNEINCLSSVTGAKKDSSSGDIYIK
tara:strand:- start:7178 stop:8227 length:1050 start_codon:yes stop_codon:yes gene_type:complete